MRRRPIRSKAGPSSRGAGGVAEREGEDVEGRAGIRHAVEAHQHHGIGEEDGVVEEGLRHHQRQGHGAAHAVASHQQPGHVAQCGRRAAGRGTLCRRRPRRGCGSACGNALLDLAQGRVGFVEASVHGQPARTFRHVAAHQQDGHGQRRAQAEAGAPPARGAQHAGIQQEQAEPGAERGTQPERPVDGQVDASRTRAGSVHRWRN